MSRLLTICLLGFATLLATACNNPAADKPKATATEATTPTSTAAGQGEKYAITSDSSKIEFVGSKVTGRHIGSFQKFSGVIDYLGQPEKSRVTINIDMNSVATDTDKLTEHLKTADFFDVAKFPQATFESTDIKPGGENGATHIVTGNLELHGVKKAISFPATITVNGNAVTVDSEFAINRKDFGINYAGAADNLIRDDVVLTFRIRGVKT
jgi:polyisoprenoid-binding protein YceI